MGRRLPNINLTMINDLKLDRLNYSYNIILIAIKSTPNNTKNVLIRSAQ
jgi:hypothetical protein